MKISKMRDKRLYAFLDIVFNIFKKNKGNVNQLIVFRNSICFFSGEYAGKYNGEYPGFDFKMLENGTYSLAKAPDGSLEFQYLKDEVFSPAYFNEKILDLHGSNIDSRTICEIDGLDEYVASRITASSGIWIKDSDVKLFSKLYRPHAKKLDTGTGFLIEDYDDYGYLALIRIIYADSNLYQNTQTSLNDYDYDDETGEVISTDEEPIEEEAPQVEEQTQPDEEEQHQEPQQLNLDDLDELDVEPPVEQEEEDDPWEIPAMDF